MIQIVIVLIMIIELVGIKGSREKSIENSHKSHFLATSGVESSHSLQKLAVADEFLHSKKRNKINLFNS